MKKLILFSTLLAGLYSVTTAQIVNIPDANLKSYLVNNVSINTDADTEISVSEAEAFSGAIIVTNTNISDLTGIEAFKNITRLDCDENNLTEVDVSNNLELTRLHCANNNLTSLDVSLNTKMTEILCHNNDLTELNIANGQNRFITNSYGYMKCYGNPNLSCINVDPGYTIPSENGQYSKGWTKDATSNTSWHCYQPANYITFTDANFENELISLHDLNYDDRISEYEAAYITEINVENKEISDLSGIEYITELEELNVNNNDLTTLDLSSNTDLIKLEAGYNSINSLDLPTNLEELTINDNELTSIDVSIYPNLKTLNLNRNNISAIDLKDNSELTHLLISENELGSLDVSNNLQLVGIDCQNNELTSIDVALNTLLTRLHCANNQLTSLDVSNNTQMVEILCYNNNLTVLNIANGRNATINSSNGYMKAYDNPNLTCINVDAGLNSATYDETGMYSKGWTKDDHASYSNTCDLTTPILKNTTEIGSFAVYPNPAKSFIHVAKGPVKVFDNYGNELIKTTSNGRIDVSKLTPGVYFIVSENRTEKLIIE